MKIDKYLKISEVIEKIKRIKDNQGDLILEGDWGDIKHVEISVKQDNDLSKSMIVDLSFTPNKKDIKYPSLKISQIVNQLEEIKTMYGDLFVYSNKEPIDRVFVNPTIGEEPRVKIQ